MTCCSEMTIISVINCLTSVFMGVCCIIMAMKASKVLNLIKRGAKTVMNISDKIHVSDKGTQYDASLELRGIVAPPNTTARTSPTDSVVDDSMYLQPNPGLEQVVADLHVVPGLHVIDEEQVDGAAALIEDNDNNHEGGADLNEADDDFIDHHCGFETHPLYENEGVHYANDPDYVRIRSTGARHKECSRK